MNRLLLRQGITCLGAAVFFAFAAGSPGQLAFWVIFFGVLAVTVPAFAVATWFWREARRIEQDPS